MSRTLQKLRALSHVWRWNYHPRIRQESVAEHSYWTAVYAYAIAVDMKILPYRVMDAVINALFHDAEEAITGDLPAPVKRGKSWDDVKVAALREMQISYVRDEEVVNDVVKAGDLLSALVFTDEEVKMGNSMMTQIRNELIYAFTEHVKRNAALAKSGMKLFSGLGFNIQDARPFIKEISHL